MKRYTTLVLFLVNLTALAQLKYPASKMVDSADTYFGTTYKDPYRWLEDMKDTTVVSWFKQQAGYTNAVMNKIAGRDELIAEWKTLDRSQPAVYNSKIFKNGSVFYRKTMPGESVGKLYYRIGLNGTETLLFDPQTYIKGQKLTIETFMPSHDARYIAISYSQNGAEVSTTKIMDVTTQRFLPEELFPTADILGWSPDNKSLLYLALNSADNTDTQAKTNIKTKLHVLGTGTAGDRDFFSNASYPELKIAPGAYPEVHVSGNLKYLVAQLYSTSDEYYMYSAPITEFNAQHIHWKLLFTPDDQLVKNTVINNGTIYGMPHKGAPNFKFVSTSMEHPDWVHAKDIIPEKRNQTLQDVIACKDFILVNYSDGINSHLYQYSFKTHQVAAIKLPYSGTAGVSVPDRTTDDCLVYINSWNKPLREFNFNAVTGIFTPSPFNKPKIYPPAYSGLQVKEVQVKGYDGAMIPLSIIYRKGTRLDGNNACIIEAYGAYGESLTPYFSQFYNALAVRGVTIAIAHVRGGGEKGDNWYRAGLKMTKANTWKDLNSCAEYLIRQKYTMPSKLAGTGTSAGGIAIARAITERPELYAAAVCNVGLANAIRFEHTATGAGNVSEFGTVKDSLEAKALFEMDGVAHVVNGTRYPAVMCVAGWNDHRVIAWEPGKFAAALQNASRSGKPVLMKVNYDSGHFTEDKNVTYADFADQYAFALWQCGHPDFQLKK